MFENIHNKVDIPKQEQDKKGFITNKKVGRPKAPNMEKVQIKMDKAFHAHIKNMAKKTGVTKSALITIALKSFLQGQDKKYRLVEVSD